jgi:adenosylcobinamide kinase/adenosylcobinamide-phosphate guanylyltransferase
LIANQENATLIIVTNEIGMGVHAATEIGRKFTELQGWMNQFLASKADEVVLMVSGIPVKIKG